MRIRSFLLGYYGCRMENNNRYVYCPLPFAIFVWAELISGLTPGAPAICWRAVINSTFVVCSLLTYISFLFFEPIPPLDR